MSSRFLCPRLTFPLRQTRRQPHNRLCARFVRPSHRWQSSSAAKASSSQSAWTTGRVLLFSAFAGSLTYLYGVIDTGPQADHAQKHDEVLRLPYGSTEDLAKVGLIPT